MRHVLSLVGWGVVGWRPPAATTDGPWRSCARVASAPSGSRRWTGSSGRPSATAPRRIPRSVGMNASGSRNARMATYSAVHGPIPGSATRERRSSVGSAPASMTTSPASTASASATRARRRPAGMENAPGSRSARSTRAAGVGKRWVTAPTGAGRRSPAARTSRPATVRAPGTETCCPMTARTASSKPSAAPGTRRPGSRRTRSPISGSSHRASKMATGSASRSSSWRHRATAVCRSRRSARISAPST